MKWTKTVWATLWILLCVGTACQNEASDTDGEITEGKLDSLRAESIADSLRVSNEPIPFDACDLLDHDQLMRLGEIERTQDLTVENVHQQAGKSTCIFTWDGGHHTLVFQMEYNERRQLSPDRYTNYLNHLVESGERVDPRFPDSLYRFVPVESSVGTAAVWSAQQRSVRWHVDNIYQGFMFLTHGALTPSDAATDSVFLTTLAARTNQLLPRDQE